LLQSELLSVAHVNSSVPHRLSLATAAASQHGRCGAEMINNNWQLLEVGLMDMREIEKSRQLLPAIA